MKIIKNFCLLLLCLFLNTLSSQTDPNIVLIIVDDMGWSQVSTGLTNLNNPSDFYETPNIETLASEGIAFPYGYVNGGNCAPTRAAILSGQFGARPTNNVFNVHNLNRGNTSSNSTLIGPDMGLASNGQDQIPSTAITIAETLKTAGYTTAHWGKYHSGEDEATNFSNNAPTDQGFDYNYGGGQAGGPGNYFASANSPYTFGSNIDPNMDVYADPYTLTESIALSVNGDNALEGTPKHVTDALADAAIDFMEAEKNTPFFMHFSNFAIHGPTGQSHARPDLYAKYVAKNNTNPSSMGHNNLGIAAILEGMDQTLGRLVDYLKTTADPRNPGQMLSENTLVYLISDNGGAINTQENGPLKGMKGEYTEGGIRSVTFAWSEASWLANKGTVNTTPIQALDLYPTFVEAGGGNLPSGYDIDGASQWQMLTNGTTMTREAIYWHFPGYLIDSKRDSRPTSIVRKGDYKLRYNYETLSYELYDLINDISEATNLLAGSPSPANLIIGNDMSILLRNHLINTSAPLPTYRSDGTTVPLPFIININGGIPNSTDGCQALSGYSAYWDFDIAEGANDASVNGNNPNPINGVLTYDAVDFVEGDQSVVFNGNVDINYSSSTFMSLATSTRTVSAWIKPTGLTGIQEIYDEGGNTVGIGMRLNGSNLESVVRSTLSIADNLSATFPNDGDWHHVALVYDGANTSHKLFIDSVVVASSTSAPATIGSHNSTGGGIGGVIGSWDSFANAADSYFTGKMDAFAVYDSVISDAGINTAACVSSGGNSTAGCQASNGYEAYWDFDTANSVIGADVSGNSHNPIIIDGVLTGDASDFMEGDQSVVFNGLTEVRYNDGTFINAAISARTFMAWIKPTNLSGIQTIFDEGGSGNGIALQLNGTNLEASLSYNKNGNTDPNQEVDAGFPNDGEWHHVALIFNGSNSTLSLYIDGALADSSTSSYTEIGSHTSPGGLGGVIGGDAFGNSGSIGFYTGKMDAVAVYNSALSLAEVEASACLSQVVADAGADVDICEGDSTTLTASGGTSYLWSTGDTTASISVSPSSTTTYTVTVSDGGDSDDDDVIVTVNPLPTADAGTDVTICEGDSTTLTATGGDTYLWSTGATTASINVSPLSNTTYSVTVTTNGCSANDDVMVAVNPVPIADAGVDVIICEGDSTTLTASGGASYLWSTGATTASINVSPAATIIYTVTVTSNGCSSNDDVEVTVNPLPTANAGVDVSICEGDSATLTASGGDSYLWSTGATTASINVSPTSTTTYSVTATSNGCSSNDDVEVSVNTIPTANAGTDVTICEGDTTTLTASGGDTYLWNTGATTASINVSPSSTTIYSVTVATNDCSSNDDVEVMVNPMPNANAGVDVGICNGDSTILTASGGGTYLWSTGETTATITVSPNSTTLYSVVVTNNGCSDSDDVTVIVGSPVVANAGADVTICDGNSTILSASGGTNYLWNTGETTQSISVNPSSTLTYTVIVTTNGCSDIDSVTVNVDSAPNVSAGSDVAICEGNSTILTASGATNYFWSPSIGLNSTTGSSVNSSPASTTTYQVSFVNGCGTLYDSVTVSIVKPTAASSPDDTVCFNEEIEIWASGGVSYLWSPSIYVTSPTNDTTIVNPSIPTRFRVIVSDATGCSDTSYTRINFSPIPRVNAGLDKIINFGENVTLDASHSPGVFSWIPHSSLNCFTCVNSVAQPSNTTLYIASLTDAYGCIVYDTVRISLDGALYVPNSFSPNSDLKNDVFKVSAEDILTFEILIFNRWGELIYESTNINEGWDGTYKGVDSQIGTYIWKLKYSDINTKDKEVIGHVSLIR